MNPEWMAQWMATSTPEGLRNAAKAARSSAVAQLEMAVRMEIAANALEEHDASGLAGLERNLRGLK